MERGRKRVFNAGIPAHIDQSALPKGIYWDNNRWYVLDPHPDGGRPRKRTVAWRSARLSELHAIMEARAGRNPRGCIAHLVALFEASTEFAELARRTQADYVWLAKQACSYVLSDGRTLGECQVEKQTVPGMQRLLETLAKGRPATRTQPAIPATPTKANQILRYLRRLFAWGGRHGHCSRNPGQGVRLVREVAKHKMPSMDAYDRVLTFARDRGALKAHSAGSVSPYMHAVMVLAFGVRLRGIEVNTLTDAHLLDVGILSNRRKGSEDNITRWYPELRDAVAWLKAYRQARWEAMKRPIPMQPEQRQLLVSESGMPLTKSSLDSAWQRMIRSAIKAGVIADTERFSLHGLKHLGITYSDDPAAGGHKSEAMRRRYDHRLKTVEPPHRA